MESNKLLLSLHNRSLRVAAIDWQQPRLASRVSDGRWQSLGCDRTRIIFTSKPGLSAADFPFTWIVHDSIHQCNAARREGALRFQPSTAVFEHSRVAEPVDGGYDNRAFGENCYYPAWLVYQNGVDDGDGHASLQAHILKQHGYEAYSIGISIIGPNPLGHWVNWWNRSSSPPPNNSVCSRRHFMIQPLDRV